MSSPSCPPLRTPPRKCSIFLVSLSFSQSFSPWIPKYSPSPSTDVGCFCLGGDLVTGPAEMPDNSATNWELTEEKLERDPFSYLQPYNDPFYGPSASTRTAQSRVPSQFGLSRWSSSYGSSPTRSPTSSARSTRSVRISETGLHTSRDDESNLQLVMEERDAFVKQPTAWIAAR